MKKILVFVVPALLIVAGCNHEEPEVPLSPQAQEALKTGRTGPPPQANQDPNLAGRKSGMAGKPSGK